VQVFFTPTATGQRNGAVTLASNAVGSPQTITLTGGVTPDFAMAAAAGGSTTQTVTAGQTANYSLVLTPAGGFTGTVTLSCSGQPQNGSCAVAPGSVTVSGIAATPFTVGVTTAARSASTPGTVGAGMGAGGRGPGTLAWMLAFAVGSLWLTRGRRRLISVLGPLATLAMVALLLMVGCGGGSTSTPPPVHTGTPAGTYTIVVTATSGSTTHTQNLTLTVN
jgi:hypothetical protein